MTNTSCDNAVDGLQIDTLSVLTLLVICFISLAVGTTVVIGALFLADSVVSGVRSNTALMDPTRCDYILARRRDAGL